jgi:uncharacterized protein YukE
MNKSDNTYDFGKYINRIDTMQERIKSYFQREKEINEELSHVWKGKESQEFCSKCLDEDEHFETEIMKGLDNLKNHLEQKEKEDENGLQDDDNEAEQEDDDNGTYDIDSRSGSKN